MTDLPVRQQPRWWLPDLWPNLVTGFPSSLPAVRQGHLIKLEDEMDDGHYVLRAELPGLDPDKDVDITVRDGRLTINAELTAKIVESAAASPRKKTADESDQTDHPVPAHTGPDMFDLVRDVRGGARRQWLRRPRRQPTHGHHHASSRGADRW